MNARRFIRHLVGALLKKPWHIDPQCLRGFHIQNQFEPPREVKRQVKWLFTLEDPVYESGAAPVYVAYIGTIRNETSHFCELTNYRGCGQTVFQCHLSDSVGKENSLNNDSVRLLLGYCCECGFCFFRSSGHRDR